MKKLRDSFNAADKHLARPWRSRRWAFLTSVAVGLGLVLYCTFTGTPIMGENILLALLGGGGITYTAGKVWETVRTGGPDSEDI